MFSCNDFIFNYLAADTFFMTQEKKLVDPIILGKLESFCSYQERCELEVYLKASKLGVSANDITPYISILQNTDFLSNSRFAKSFALGRFRQNHWGRNKIRAALRAKRIPNDLISISLSLIPEDEYLQSLKEIIDSKVNPEKFGTSEKAKLIRFLIQRGFETDLIYDQLNAFD